MANTIRIKRRAPGGATGAPASLENAELAYNEADDTLYYGKGTGGAGGTATTVEAIAGAGAYITKGTDQTITGNKTFSGTVIVPTPSSSTHAVTKGYVDTAIGGVATAFTVSGDSGSNQTITSGSDTLSISGGTGIDTISSATDTITINIDSTVATLTGTQTLQNKTLTGSSYNANVVDVAALGSLEIKGGNYGVTISSSGDRVNYKTWAFAEDGTLYAPGNVVFEGATANDYETTLAITDPTADRTITLPNNSGTVALTSDLPTSMSYNLYGDSGVISVAATTAGSGGITLSGGTGLTSTSSGTSVTLNLDDTTVSAGSYGTSTATGTFTVDAQGRLTAASATNIRTASTTLTGLASFDSADFSVTSGAVSIKAGGVDNVQLSNSTITLGSSTLTLGSTTTSVAGITELTVDNINFNGNEISTTDSNGNLSLNPNGTGTVTINGHRITNLGTPTADSDAATKGYVDNRITGLTWKAAVNVIAKSDVPLTGSTPLTIDGHTLSDGYRILLVAQSTDSQNGIYDLAISGGSYALTRSTDADSYTEFHGISVFVQEGDTYRNTGWVQTSDYLTDFSGQVWVQFSGAGAYGAGSGLSMDGTTFNVNVDANGGIEISGDAVVLKPTVAGAGLTIASGILAVGGTTDKITVNADSITIASTYIGQSSITTLGTISVGTWNGDTIAIANGGTGSTTSSDARTALGLAIGSNVQGYSANLAAIAGLTSASNALPYFTGSGTAAVTTLSSFVRDFLDDADAATARTTLGVDSYTIDGGTF